LLPPVIECKPLPLPFTLYFVNQTAPWFLCSWTPPMCTEQVATTCPLPPGGTRLSSVVRHPRIPRAQHTGAATCERKNRARVWNKEERDWRPRKLEFVVGLLLGSPWLRAQAPVEFSAAGSEKNDPIERSHASVKLCGKSG
jgi:hypothetical protein